MILFYSAVLLLGLLCNSNALNIEGASKASTPVTLEYYDTTILPGRQDCGIIKETPKIYGGVAAHLGEFPWAVSIQYKSATNEEEVSTLCGGSLINSRYILTSANCVSNNQRIPVTAVLGDLKLSSDPDCINSECADPVVKVKIQNIIAHEAYDKKTWEHDLALLRLEKDVAFTEFIRPICLPPKNLPFPQLGQKVTVSGWGKTELGKVSDVLLKVDLPIASSEECSTKLKRAVTKNSFCAGGESGKDACTGDSGSFAIGVYEDDVNEGKWYQYGIVSAGAGCGVEGRAAVYTKVDQYMDWIVATIKKFNAL